MKLKPNTVEKKDSISKTDFQVIEYNLKFPSTNQYEVKLPRLTDPIIVKSETGKNIVGVDIKYNGEILKIYEEKDTLTFDVPLEESLIIDMGRAYLEQGVEPENLKEIIFRVKPNKPDEIIPYTFFRMVAIMNTSLSQVEYENIKKSVMVDEDDIPEFVNYILEGIVVVGYDFPESFPLSLYTFTLNNDQSVSFNNGKKIPLKGFNYNEVDISDPQDEISNDMYIITGKINYELGAVSPQVFSYHLTLEKVAMKGDILKIQKLEFPLGEPNYIEYSFTQDSVIGLKLNYKREVIKEIVT